MATISEILDETKQYIAVKEASFKGGFKRAQAMNGIDTMPGSEHDSKVPTEYEKPDPEVDDGSQGPEGVFSNIDGAGKEDITMKHVLEVDEAAETPDQEPLITDEADAEPKTAAAAANKLLAHIKQFQTTKRAANQRVNLKLDEKMLDKLAEQKPVEKKAAEQKPVEKKPVEKKAAEQKPVEKKPVEKKAAEQKPVEKKPTAKEIAQHLIAGVMAQKQAAAKQAEQQGAEDALRDVLEGAYTQGVNDALEKIAQMAAAADPAVAQALAGSDPSAVGGQEAMSAMAGAAPEQPAADTGADLSVPEDMKGEEISADESGEIDPETAQAVLSELAAGAAGDEGGASEAASEEPSAEDKEAAEKFAEAITEAHNEIVAQQTKQAQDAGDAAAASDDVATDEPTVEEVQQAVAELVDEGEIDAETGAAILEQIGAGDAGDIAAAEEGDKEASVKSASAQEIKQAAEFVRSLASEYRKSKQEKQAAEFVRSLASEYRNAKQEKQASSEQAQFEQAIKEASDEIDAAVANTADDDEAAGTGEDVNPEELIQGIAELVEAGEISPEDAEDALHAILGDEGAE